MNEQKEFDKPIGERYMVKRILKDCEDDIFNNIVNNKSHPPDPLKATYGNKLNTFTGTETPYILDYIFHTTSMNGVVAWTEKFEIPEDRFKANSSSNGQPFSLSDHSPLIASIRLQGSDKGTQLSTRKQGGNTPLSDKDYFFLFKIVK